MLFAALALLAALGTPTVAIDDSHQRGPNGAALEANGPYAYTNFTVVTRPRRTSAPRPFITDDHGHGTFSGVAVAPKSGQ